MYLSNKLLYKKKLCYNLFTSLSSYYKFTIIFFHSHLKTPNDFFCYSRPRLAQNPRTGQPNQPTNQRSRKHTQNPAGDSPLSFSNCRISGKSAALNTGFLRVKYDGGPDMLGEGVPTFLFRSFYLLIFFLVFIALKPKTKDFCIALSSVLFGNPK